ncbi:MFS transporter [Candidatus Microgenomates bacterium]|nr:MFS transporter [Candidatus Microgenomates bacterium]
MNRKNVFLWTLYDFANSIFVVVFFLYFSQWLVIDNGLPDLFYNLLFTGSSILLVLTSPVAGTIADKLGVKLLFLKVVTVLIFLALLATSLFTLQSKTTSVAITAGLLFMLANYFYQLSFAFYNSLLSDIAPSQKQGFISGLGNSLGWLGQFAGILITLPLVANGRENAFLPATIIFFVLSLPMLLFFKENKVVNKVKINVLSEYKEAIGNFRALVKSPGIGNYLLGFFFFNDAMLTAVNNFPIYLQQVFSVSDKVKSALLAAILITCAIGAFAAGWVSDKVGLKKSLIAILVCWIVVIPTMAIVTEFRIFVILAVVLGFLYGATWTVTRAVMTYLAPVGKLNQSFSYYTMFERFSTFVGPVAWGGITFYLLSAGSIRYQVAMASMTIFVLIGLLIVRNIPAKATRVI